MFNQSDATPTLPERRMTLAQKLTDERRRRLAAERLLELKQAELIAANRKLGKHARQLSEKVLETRAEVETIKGENQRFKSDLTAAKQRVAVTERRLWHTIETIKDGFAFFNASNEMIMANDAYLQIFDHLDVIGPGVNYVTILQMMTDEGIVNTGALSPLTWRQMMIDRFELPAPEPIVIQLWNGTHIKLIDQRGPEGDVVSLGLDITSAVHYEHQLREARTTAESANHAKSAFLANMSHEIRTPMNGVVGMAEVLAETDLTDEQLLYVNTIKNSGEALLVIINDVLDYSKIEAGKLTLKTAAFDLEATIQEVLTLLQPAAQDKGLALTMEYDPALPTCLIGDQGRLRQIMTNLIGNAVKFTTKGHVLVRVTGAPDQDRSKVALSISVQDTGIGIPADQIDHIFGEFNQVENARNRQFDGTGLGLSITQRLVHLMEGEIGVKANEPAGATFCIKLQLAIPAQPEKPAPDQMPRHAQSAPAPPARQRPLRILAAEDNRTNQLVFRKMIKDLSVELHFASNGKEALALFRDTKPDIVFMDISMPVMDGREATLAIRKAEMGTGRHVPIIALTAHAMTEDHHAILSAGLDHYLTKPLRKADILTRIKEAHGDHHLPLLAETLGQVAG